jgi:hypothetical protein
VRSFGGVTLSEALLRLDDFDPGVTATAMVDDDGGAFRHPLAIDQLSAWLGTAQIGEGSEAETGEQLSLIAIAQSAQGAGDASSSHVSDPDEA